MSLTILFRWDGQAAWPVSGWADLQKLPVNGPYLTATITQPRSPAHHRRTFALINAAYENWPDTHAFQPDSAEHLRAWLVIEAGHGKREYFRVKPTAGPNGISLLCAMVIKAGAKHKFPFYAADADKIVLRYADTLSWARVNQRAFAPLAAKIADIICVETGLTEQQLLPARDNEQAGGCGHDAGHFPMTSPALASDDRLLVALPEAARLVSLSQATIRRMCADGRMPPLVKIGSRSLVQVDALRRVAQLGPGLGADQTGVLQSQQSQ